MEDLEDRLEIQPPKEPEGSPSWRVQVEYTNHTEQDICSYEDHMPDRPEELYFSLLEYFVVSVFSVVFSTTFCPSNS